MELVRKGTNKWCALREEFLTAQDGLCGICLESINDPHLDHCHKDGFIRGVLCNRCNIMLGWYEARRQGIEDYLARAGEYQAYQVGAAVSIREHWQRKFPTKAGQTASCVAALAKTGTDD